MEVFLSVLLGGVRAVRDLVLAKTIRIVPQAHAGVVERFGKYKATLPPASTS